MQANFSSLTDKSAILVHKPINVLNLIQFWPFKYCKIPIISPGLIFVQTAFLLGLFSRELIFEGNFAFQNGLGLTIKTGYLNTKQTTLKQPTLTVHGLIFRRAYYWRNVCI